VRGDDDAAATIDRLQHIDARLAAIEADGMRRLQIPSRQSPRMDLHAKAEADRRLAAMLSDRGLDRDELLQWQSTPSELPPDQRFERSAAFARAVNQGCLKFQP
jgi:hypothetical protein